MANNYQLFWISYSKGNMLREVQSHKGMISASVEELSALMPSILVKAFKGEL
jgi:hypothetical protein